MGVNLLVLSTLFLRLRLYKSLIFPILSEFLDNCFDLVKKKRRENLTNTISLVKNPKTAEKLKFTPRNF